MERQEPPWYRVLGSRHLAYMALATVTWGWLLLLPCFGIPYGLAVLFGVDVSAGSSGLTAVLIVGSLLSLLSWFCVGYSVGRDDRGREAHYDEYRTRNQVGGEYQRDVSDLQEQARTQRRRQFAETGDLARRLESATLRCRICPGFSALIYNERGDVYGVCNECDELIRSDQRGKLIARRAERLAELIGLETASSGLLQAAGHELAGVGRGKIDRVPHSFWSEREMEFDPNETLEPKSWGAVGQED